MKSLLLILTLSATLAAADLPLRLPKLTTRAGKEFVDVTITQKLPDGVKIVHSNGAAKILAEALPDDVVAMLGGFDYKAAAALREANATEAATTAAKAKAGAEQKAKLAAMKWEGVTLIVEMTLQDGALMCFPHTKGGLAGSVASAIGRISGASGASYVEPITDYERPMHVEGVKGARKKGDVLEGEANFNGTIVVGKLAMDRVLMKPVSKL